MLKVVISSRASGLRHLRQRPRDPQRRRSPAPGVEWSRAWWSTGVMRNSCQIRTCMRQRCPLPTRDIRGCGVRRLAETFFPGDAGLTFAFKEGWREHSELCDRQPDTEGGRHDKSGGMKVNRNRLTTCVTGCWPLGRERCASRLDSASIVHTQGQCGLQGCREINASSGRVAPVHVPWRI